MLKIKKFFVIIMLYKMKNIFFRIHKNNLNLKKIFDIINVDDKNKFIFINKKIF